MQICVRNHVEVHPQNKKEVLYFVKKKNLGVIGESSDQLSEWAIPENIHTIPRTAFGISEGEGGFTIMEF